MAQTIRVALSQLPGGLNRAKAQVWIEKHMQLAHQKKAKLIVFPEMIFGKDEPQKTKSPWIKHLAKLAAHYRLFTALPIPLQSKQKSQKCTNSILLLSDRGQIKARYDKIHLFDMKLSREIYQESRWIREGSKPTLVSCLGTKIGLSICYDLRFPELFRKLSQKGAEIILAPSAFTATTGKVHWDILTRTRALENLSYLIAPARAGTAPDGRKTYGHSRVVSPWGQVLAEKKTGFGLLVADLDLNHLRQIRKTFPVLSHRKLW